MNKHFLNEINQLLEQYQKTIMIGFFCDLMDFINDYSNQLNTKDFVYLSISKYGESFSLLAKESSPYYAPKETFSTLLNKIKDKSIKEDLLNKYEVFHKGYSSHIKAISEQMQKFRFLSKMTPIEEYGFLPNQLSLNISIFTKQEKSQEAQTFAIEIEKVYLEKSFSNNKNNPIEKQEEKIKTLKI